MAYQDRIAACNDADLAAYAPWSIDTATGPLQLGHVARRHVPWLCRTGAFADAVTGLQLLGHDFASRSARLEQVASRLPALGLARPLLGEPYPVLRSFGSAPFARLDRAAVPFFGVRPFGVHVNGFVRRADGLHLWIAERSRQRPTYPGRLDNMVAGGQPLGLSLTANVQKECHEEAGLDGTLAARAVPVAAITYVQAGAHGLKPDTLFCYDLELPADCTPVPQDGEVERFELLPVAAVQALVRDTDRFKPNCALVLVDFFLRHGCLDGELPPAAQAALATALRRELP